MASHFNIRTSPWIRLKVIELSSSPEHLSLFDGEHPASLTWRANCPGNKASAIGLHTWTVYLEKLVDELVPRWGNKA
ncbi:hypothetical protein RRG08_060947 [Elysia crispata]|uniref:Uncharacterized protein n=1 Tax=Elysia crispata TaxID=231223 RepID=A0AAE1AVS2_9GAST|nr:hypothetical protein RRG08_060947 [Elysia crispata]